MKTNRYRTIVSCWMLSIALAGCGESDEEDYAIGSDEEAINTNDCNRLGDPFPGCTTAANKTNCGRVWNKDGWTNDGRPICLGFGTDIQNCSNCNYLNIDDWDLCKNKLFLDCNKAGLIPGSTSGSCGCFVTAPSRLDAPASWPASGQVTAREMCYCGVPSTLTVSDCKKKGKCKAAKKPPAKKTPMKKAPMKRVSTGEDSMYTCVACDITTDPNCGLDAECASTCTSTLCTDSDPPSLCDGSCGDVCVACDPATDSNCSSDTSCSDQCQQVDCDENMIGDCDDNCVLP